jgi:hypothetical protein
MLTLDGSEVGKHRGAAGQAGATAVGAPALVQARGGLHRDLVLEVCWKGKQKEATVHRCTSLSSDQ